MTISLKNLDAVTIPLSGIHLIEASAGTGKTYNITRIYLRLILERELTVEQILLMTFTKDATQELRGRIDSTIRLALSSWDELCKEDDFFAALHTSIAADKREFLLKRALLFLDEAAIFTIHGFCQRVLKQYAFTSGLPFNANMVTNTNEITLQVCQDWYRRLAKTDIDNFHLIASFWATPASFISSFSKAISHTSELSVIDETNIAHDFIHLVRTAKQSLKTHEQLIEVALITSKKGAAQEKRRQELAALLNWLEEVIDESIPLLALNQAEHKMPDAFIDGRRYGSKYKAELVDAFYTIKQVKEQAKDITKNINKAKAYGIVKSAIYSIRSEVIENKKTLNLIDFDDLINTLANTLAQPSSDCFPDLLTSSSSETEVELSNGQRLAQLLLAQYPVALVDEFQDTDPKQFGILQAIYYAEQAKSAQAGLFLIGDPKQAIYGFRGGDIFAYLNARSGCDHHWLMDTNWRSTPEMIDGYNQVFSDKHQVDTNEAQAQETTQDEPEPEVVTSTLKKVGVFGYGIPYSPVLAGKATLSEQSNDLACHKLADKDKALQFVHFKDVAEPSGNNEQTEAKVGQGSRSVLANWCANEIDTLLNSNQPTKVKPKDIAILVRDGAEARDVKHALQQAGLDSVFLSDRANLFHSKQAKQLLALLKGIIFVENERLFVAALSGGLLGFTPSKLYQVQQHEFDYQALKFSFMDYRTQWQRYGFIAMAMNLMHQHINVPDTEKDRCITNLLHLFEILQAASVRLNEGQALLHWFEQQCYEETSDVEAELRLESDGDLIRIITQHGSKGLEYPYVFIPFVCRHKDPLKFGNKTVSYLEYHNNQGELCLSLDGSPEAKEAMSEEGYAESIRLLYVAITRAERRCYLLTCAFEKYHLSPLGKTLRIAEQDNIMPHLQALKNKAEAAIGIHEISFCSDSSEQEPVHASANNSDINSSDNRSNNTCNNSDNTGNNDNQSIGFDNTTQLNSIEDPLIGVAKFSGSIERNWWLSSFTALSRNSKHAGVSNPDRDFDPVLQTKSNAHLPKQAIDVLTPDQFIQESQHICFSLAKGAHTGNLLHDVLETVDFCQPNWQESMEKPLQKYGDLNASLHENIRTKHTQDELNQWFDEIVTTEFITSEQDDSEENLASLSDLPMNKTLRESEFYFPMQGQGTKALAILLTDHRNRITYQNGRAHYPVLLPNHQQLSGMMHGFIDLIFEHQGKYYVCDYKSNHLGDHYLDYQFDALLDNVEKNYYDLQYLIYCVALHRYLKNTLADYDVNTHFGGVYYLYLRGMTTNSTYQGTGVYYRNVSEQEISRLDNLFKAQTLQVNKESSVSTPHNDTEA